MTRTWVVGRGLLGGAVRARLLAPRIPFDPPQPFSWKRPDVLAGEIDRAAKSFCAELRDGEDWELIWCAGAAVIGAAKEDTEAEAATWSRLLDGLEDAGLAERRGRILLASSAGAVHGGSSGLPFTEATEPRPISVYGETKLRQERRLQEWTANHSRVSSVVARLSNLYGPGQDLRKPQGLISQLCRALILRRPFHLYVPADTTRDYLYSSDAAEYVLATLDRLALGGTANVTKILASEQDTTIAVVLGMARNLAHRYVRVIHTVDPRRARQPLRLSFRSTVWPEVRVARRTPLLEGMHAVYTSLSRIYARGSLPP